MELDKLITGTKYGKLTLTGNYHLDNQRRRVVEVLCECGQNKMIALRSLLGGKSKSCGCLRKEVMRARAKTGNLTPFSERPLIYKRWKDIIRRCYNPRSKDFKNYGGRGISVCNEWKNFDNFLQWATLNGWSKELSIERNCNDENYQPSNCKWGSDEEQRRNKRSNRRLVIFGESKIITDWAKDSRSQVTVGTFSRRLQYGWEPEEALTSPIQKLRRKRVISLAPKKLK